VVLSHRGNSYKLYAHDVIEVPIKADLVTISGCESAGVRAYAGEGLIGFAWAFLKAGAHAVVAGLWDVSDISTEPLMNLFYGGIANGEDAVTAMRQAKQELRKHPEYSKPYYWAPFQVYLSSARK
jgi:CHAT domain-containing protein